jgi:large subunit ribosomal protein L13
MIVDASNLLLGRLATSVAKKALIGEKIDIINCENAVISGKKKMIIARYKQQKERGEHSHGPFFQSMPDRFVRRTIRGMLPYKTPKGRDAFKRIMCHIGTPTEFKDGKKIEIKEADAQKLPILSSITVGEVCSLLGGKSRWLK